MVMGKGRDQGGTNTWEQYINDTHGGILGPPFCDSHPELFKIIT